MASEIATQYPLFFAGFLSNSADKKLDTLFDFVLFFKRVKPENSRGQGVSKEKT